MLSVAVRVAERPLPRSRSIPKRSTNPWQYTLDFSPVLLSEAARPMRGTVEGPYPAGIRTPEIPDYVSDLRPDYRCE